MIFSWFVSFKCWYEYTYSFFGLCGVYDMLDATQCCFQPLNFLVLPTDCMLELFNTVLTLPSGEPLSVEVYGSRVTAESLGCFH